MQKESYILAVEVEDDDPERNDGEGAHLLGGFQEVSPVARL